MSKVARIIIAVIVIANNIHAITSLIYIDPMELIFKRIEVGYEIKLSPKSSLAIIPTYEGIDLENEWHSRIKLAYNYTTQHTFQGFWISSSLSLFYAELENLKQTTIEPGIGFGKRWLIESNYFVGIGIGAGPSFELYRDPGIFKRKAYFYSMFDFGYVF